jgi:hypothetical protein
MSNRRSPVEKPLSASAAEGIPLSGNPVSTDREGQFVRTLRWCLATVVGAALLLAAPSMAVAATVSLAASESATPSVEPTPTPLPVWRLEDDDLRTQFGGAWVSGWLSTASGQTYRTSTRQGAWARASFEGTGVAFVTRRGPDRGRAKIYVDGVVRATVSLYSSAAEPSRVVWRSDALAQGRHEVKVVVLGSKVVASKGYFVPVDAFEITGTPVAATVSGTIVNNGSSDPPAGAPRSSCASRARRSRGWDARTPTRARRPSTSTASASRQ